MPDDETRDFVFQYLDRGVTFGKSPEELEEDRTRLTEDFELFFERVYGDRSLSDNPEASHWVGEAKRALDMAKHFIDEVPDPQLRFCLSQTLQTSVMALALAGPASLPAAINRDAYHREQKSAAARVLGRKRAESRQKAAAKWQEPALASAKQARGKNPTLSQAELAEKIEKTWGTSRPVGRDRLMKVIAAWEKSGELQKRSKI